ncbi:MAG: oxygenase MpaB family protein, partial [Candidatus Limnocylindria bacterium]
MDDGGILPRGSVARRVDRELFLLLGGSAALLMQLAHPLVAAGVAQHSDFRRAPLARLRRTLDTTLAVVFGDTATARAALRRIAKRHVPVSGMAADGRAYEARDPRLLLWVQTTLVLTSLRLHELVCGPLPARDRQAYWDETKPIARALGIPDALLPPSVEDLERYERRALAGEVVPDATSAECGRAVLRPFPWLPGPLHWPADALTARLVPAPLRGAYGLRWRRRDRLLFRAVIVALRAVRAAAPERLALVPQARRYE